MTENYEDVKLKSDPEVNRKFSDKTRPEKDLSDDEPSYVVALGASAGGLEAIEQFFDKMPSDTGLAFVIVQHLSPDFKSLMPELLRKHTDMAIHRVENDMQVKKNAVYLIPPKKEMEISDCKLQLTDKDPQSLSLPIDVFFRSLAKDRGSRSVAVILSGTGSDGSRGILDIHDSGGLVIVQDKNTAKFDGMPSSAIRTGITDFEIPPENMSATILKYVKHPLSEIVGAQVKASRGMTEEKGFSAIFSMLKKHSNIDFSAYKPATISRRIERRMLLLHLKQLDDYVARLERDEKELEALCKDLLIGVTRFFRDPQVWQFLKDNVIEKIIDSVGKEEQVRIWVPGCATGEEVYSIAIIFDEVAREKDVKISLKIFATDVHVGSLEFAANGIYDEEPMENVSSARRKRYFISHGDGKWQIHPDIRKYIVFADHDITNDPPFTKLNFISCRNLLIYLIPSVQKKVFSLFNFALTLGGYLLLGSSESMGDMEKEYQTVDQHLKIFRKQHQTKLPPSTRFTVAGKGNAVNLHTAKTFNSRNEDYSLLKVYDALLQNAITSGVLINNHNELVHTFGDTSEFISHRPGRAKFDILSMVQGDIRIALSTALSRVNKDKQSVTYNSIRVSQQGQEKFIELTVEPVLEKSSDSGYMLVSFKKVLSPQIKTENIGKFDLDNESQNRIKDLETELQYTRENLQATVEELETSNEELQASNEELMASNEELQSTNEELHSVNEELYTVNAEYEQKIQELGQITKDMNNLLNSTKIGTVFLDINLNIRKFTPAIAQSFNLLEQDIGRPIEHISHNIVGNTTLMDDIKEVRDTGHTKEKEVKNNRGRWFVKRILPYLDQSGKIEGVVLTFVDITGVKEAQKELNDAKYYAQSIVDTVAVPLITIDADMKIKTANKSFYNYFDLAPEQVEARPLTTLGAHLFDDPEVIKKLKKIFNQDRSFQDHEVIYKLKDDKEKIFSITGKKIATHNNDDLALLSINDISNKRTSERHIIKNEQMLRSAMEASLDAFFILSSIRNQKEEVVDFEFINLNSKAKELIAIPGEELIGRRLCEVLPYHREKGLFDKYKDVVNTGQAYQDEYPVESNYIKAGKVHQQVVKIADNYIAITTRVVK